MPHHEQEDKDLTRVDLPPQSGGQDLPRSQPDSSPHTPGPWAWDCRNGRHYLITNADEDATPHRIVLGWPCGLEDGTWFTKDRYGEADADLIAATPTLYAALRSIANSACCPGCQEAALVARRALGAVRLPIAVDPVMETGQEGLRAHPRESSTLTGLAAPAQEDEPPDA